MFKRIALASALSLAFVAAALCGPGPSETANAIGVESASIVRGAPPLIESAPADAHGHYVIEDFGPDGKLKWHAEIENTVVTVGKNLALDTFLAGSSYTVTGPYIGLISSTSWSAVASGDTMSSHSGWLEAGNANAPTYSGTRPTASWSSASSGTKSLASAASFSITGTGTVKGVFLVFGSGASSTIDNTGGTLYSAGTFSGGDKSVSNGDTLNVSYAASL